MSAEQRLTVPADAAGQRLDHYLSLALGCSRADVQRQIANNAITINGHPAAKDVRLRPDQIIVVGKDQSVPLPARVPEPRVVAEDDAVLVLEKPPGLIMHQGPGIHEETLADWLTKTYPYLRGIGEDPLRPGIVHRLDKEASGLVVVAKTQGAYEHLKAAFQEHRVEKHYTALVHGHVLNDGGEVRFPIDRSEQSGRMAAKPMGGDGREAVTRYTILERLAPFTLLDVTTDTGRTHQVRVHLHALGHPIAGDPLYHSRRRETKKIPPRLFLHASRLTFPHPDGTPRSFASPLPAELAAWLDGLRHT